MRMKCQESRLRISSFFNSHVTEQVFGQDNTIQLFGICDHDHSRRVDKLMIEFQLRILVLECLRHNLPPKSGACQDISLVNGMYFHWWIR